MCDNSAALDGSVHAGALSYLNAICVVTIQTQNFCVFCLYGAGSGRWCMRRQKAQPSPTWTCLPGTASFMSVAMGAPAASIVALGAGEGWWDSSAACSSITLRWKDSTGMPQGQVIACRLHVLRRLPQAVGVEDVSNRICSVALWPEKSDATAQALHIAYLHGNSVKYQLHCPTSWLVHHNFHLNPRIFAATPCPLFCRALRLYRRDGQRLGGRRHTTV